MERLQTFLQKKYFKESEVQNRGGGAIDGRLKKSSKKLQLRATKYWG